MRFKSFLKGSFRARSVAFLLFLIALAPINSSMAEEGLAIDPVVEQLIKQEKYEQAYDVLLKDGRNGNASSLTLAGDLVMNGAVKGVRPEEAIALYLDATSKNEVESMMRLAFIFKNGFGSIKPNAIKEVQYLQMAANRSHAIAYSALGWVQMTSRDNRIQNQPAGLKNIKKAIDLGSPYGIVRLGEAYWQGMAGLKRNQIVGLALYEHGKSLGVEGSEPAIEDRSKEVLSLQDVKVSYQKLRKDLKSMPYEKALELHFQANPAHFDYRSVQPKK